MKNLFLLFLLFFITNNLFAQGWEKTYLPTSNSVTVNGITKLADDYIRVVTTESEDGISKTVVYKLDEGGNLLESSVSESEESEYGKGIIELSDGGFLLFGGLDNNGGLVVRYDVLGAEVWKRNYGETYSTLTLNAAVEIETGDFILSGDAVTGFGNQVHVVKIDMNGDLIWERDRSNYVESCSTCPHWESIETMVEHETGKFILAGKQRLVVGYSNEWNHYVYGIRPYFLEIDTAGVMLNDSVIHYNSDYSGQIYDVVKADNGNLIWKIRKEGDIFTEEFVYQDSVVWQDINESNQSGGQQLAITSDNRRVITESPYKVRTFSETGEELFSQSYSYLNTNQVDDVFTGENGEVYMVGKTSNGNVGTNLIFVVKIDQAGHTNTNKIEGLVYYDANENCVFDGVDYPMPNYQIEVANLVDYPIFSDSLGHFSVCIDTGSYTLVPVAIDQDWLSCPESDTHYFSTFFDSIHVEFGIVDSCPDIFNNIITDNICGIDSGSARIESLGGIGTYSYQWSNGDTGVEAQNLSAARHYVTVNSGNCTMIDSFNMEFPLGHEMLFSKNLGGSQEDEGNNMLILADGNYLLGGLSSSNDYDLDIYPYGNGAKMWIAKTSPAGEILWENLFTNIEGAALNDMIELSNGNIILVGAENANSFFNSKGFLIELNAAGEIVYEKYFEGSHNEIISATVSPDGGLILGTSAYSSSGSDDYPVNNGAYDAYIFKLDEEHNIVWASNFGGSEFDILQDIAVDETGTIYISGHTKSNDFDVNELNHGGKDIFLAAYSSTGSLLWQHLIGGSEDENIAYLQQETTGVSLLMTSESADGDFVDMTGYLWLMKYDFGGDLQSQKSILNRTFNPTYFASQSSGNYLVTSGASILSFDQNGDNVLLDNQIGTSGSLQSNIYFAHQTEENEIIGFGNTRGGSVDIATVYGDTDYWLFKLHFGSQLITDFLPDTLICQGNEFIYDLNEFSNPNLTIEWTDEATPNPYNFNVQQDTALTFQLTNEVGCSALAKLNVLADRSELYLNATEPYCGINEGSVRANVINRPLGNPVPLYSWNTGASSYSIDIQEPGEYAVTVTTDNNCILMDTIHVSYNSGPLATTEDYFFSYYPFGCPWIFEYSPWNDIKKIGDKVFIIRERYTQRRLFVFNENLEPLDDYYFGDFNISKIYENPTGGYVATDLEMIVILDDNFNQIESFSFSGIFEPAYIKDLLVQPDGSMVVCGYSEANNGVFFENNGGDDGWVMRLNSDLSIDWLTTIGGSEYDVLNKFVIKENGDIYAAGVTSSSDGDITDPYGNADVLMAHLNAEGVLLETFNFGGTEGELFSDIAISGDDFLISGHSNSSDGDLTGTDFGDWWLFKTTSTGDILWHKKETQDNAFRQIEVTPANKIITPSREERLVQLDENGDTEWTRNVTVAYPFVLTEDMDIYAQSTSAICEQVSDFEIINYQESIRVLSFIQEPAPFALPADSTLCQGDTLQIGLPSVAGIDYNWSTGMNTDTLDITNPGYYSVTAESYPNCSHTDSIYLEPCANFELPQPDPACYEVEVEAGFFGATDYLWSTGDTSYSIIVTDSSWVSVEYTLPSGEIMVDSVFVAVVEDDIELTALIDSVACFGDSTGSISLIVNTDYDYQLNWSTGQITENLNSLPLGDYSVELINEFGCTVDSLFSIGQPDSALSGDFSIGGISCYQSADGRLASIPRDGTMPYTFLWSTGSTDSLLTELPPGEYEITLTDANGCTYIEGYSMVNPDSLIANFTFEQPNVGENNGSISIIPNGGTPPYYTLVNGEEETLYLSNLTAGTYNVQLIDGSNCVADLIIVLENTVAVNNLSDLNYRLAPNPFTDELILSFDNERPDKITVFDIIGREQFKTEVFDTGREDLSIDAKDWMPGTYFIELVFRDLRKVEKLVKIR